ncbi:DUF917 family protein, partial [Patescibacteria group bacterium]
KLSEFSKQEFLVSAYGVGDPSEISVSSKEIIRLLQKAFRKYAEETGIRPAGIIPGEIGAEVMAFQAAVFSGLPVVDADLVGGRAAPEIQMDVFSVYNLPITPILGMSFSGKSFFIREKMGAREVELRMRAFFKKNGKGGILIGYPITAGQFRKIALTGSLSLSVGLGKKLIAKNIPGALERIGGKILAKEKVLSVAAKGSGDFFQGWAKIGDLDLWIKNENIQLSRLGKTIAQAPGIIALLDFSGKPIHNSVLKKQLNKEVIVVGVLARGYWKTKRGRGLWRSAFPN